jgi:hypothetical protein
VVPGVYTAYFAAAAAAAGVLIGLLFVAGVAAAGVGTRAQKYGIMLVPTLNLFSGGELSSR